MEKVKTIFKEYRWVLISGVIIALIIGMITANIQQLYFIKCQMSGDTGKIIELLEKDVKNEHKQDDWYYIKGIEYLLKKEHLNEQASEFLERYFAQFTEARKKEIIKGYNANKKLFSSQKEIGPFVLEHMEDEDCKTYLSSIDEKAMDEILYNYFKKNNKMDAQFAKKLLKIAQNYPHSFRFNQFKFSIYDLLVMQDLEEDKKIALLSKIAPKQGEASFFTEIRTKSIEGDKLKEWIETLNASGTITTETYLNFTNLYTQVYNVRAQYKTLQAQEVNCNNTKQEIELQIGSELKELEVKQKEQASLTESIKEIETQLATLTDCAYMALYIERDLGNGIYQAAIPKKAFFGGYKASSQKYLVKLASTNVYQEGVYYMDIYLKGTKMSSDGNEYPYYEEITPEQKQHIQELEKQRDNQNSQLTILKNQISEMEIQINEIKEKTGYDQNEEELKQIDSKKKELVKRLQEIAIKIQSMFELKKVSIDLEIADEQQMAEKYN